MPFYRAYDLLHSAPHFNQFRKLSSVQLRSYTKFSTLCFILHPDTSKFDRKINIFTGFSPKALFHFSLYTVKQSQPLKSSHFLSTITFCLYFNLSVLQYLNQLLFLEAALNSKYTVIYSCSFNGGPMLQLEQFLILEKLLTSLPLPPKQWWNLSHKTFV